MLKLMEFLKSTKDFSGELLAEHLEESQFDFEWDGLEFTKEGEEKFKDILQSEIRFDTTNNRQINVIWLQNEEITQADYNLFMATLSGYVNVRSYERWIQKREDEDTHCPKCQRVMDERQIDWTKGECRICKHDEEIETESMVLSSGEINIKVEKRSENLNTIRNDEHGNVM